MAWRNGCVSGSGNRWRQVMAIAQRHGGNSIMAISGDNGISSEAKMALMAAWLKAKARRAQWRNQRKWRWHQWRQHQRNQLCNGKISSVSSSGVMAISKNKKIAAKWRKNIARHSAQHQRNGVIKSRRKQAA